MKNRFYKLTGDSKRKALGNLQMLLPLKIHFFIFLLVLFSDPVFSQDSRITVTGTVTDSSGIGIPSVSVIEKGTRNATATGTSGGFSIRVARLPKIYIFLV